LAQEFNIKSLHENANFRYFVNVRTAILLLMTLGATVYSQQKDFVPAWVRDAVFYQIFPERFANGDTTNDPPGVERWGGTPTPRNYFGGDLQGIIDHCDYLASLGVNAVYLNPIFASNTNHKYQTTDYLTIDPQFGGEGVFVKLVQALHARGIRVILDGVFNHTGVDFFAFADLRKNGPASRYAGWYNVYGYPVGPVSKPNYECWWGFGSLPKLMTSNPDVRKYLFDVTRHWTALGIDGWRLDVPNEIPHDFWVEWRALVKSINPEAYIVGEIWDDGSPWLRGDQFDAVMNYPFRAACLDFFARRTSTVHGFDAELARLRKTYAECVTYGMLNLIGSHDTERFLTLCNGDTSSLRLAVLFQMTYPGAPMVYYGDEIGMTGGKDPGCRGTMAWDTTRQDRSLLEHYRQAIGLRNAHTVLRRGVFSAMTMDDEKRIYVYALRSADEAAVVVLNNGTEEQRVEIPLRGDDAQRRWKAVWGVAGTPADSHSLAATVPARAGAVFLGGSIR
jgi:cyclomaltodextrinase